MGLDDIKGINIPDVEKVNCRDCLNAMKGKILYSRCKAYPERKPKDVYYFYANCPKYEQGEDLLKFEIQI